LPISVRRRHATDEQPRAVGSFMARSGRERKGRTGRFLALAALIFWGSLTAVQAEVSNRIVAVVNQEIITLLELEKKIRELLPPGTPANNPAIQKQVLFQLID
jgi:hypothetical protein